MSARKYMVATAVAALSLSMGVAHAVDATGTLSVTATVVKSCSVTGNTLAFGSYGGANNATISQVDGSAAITVACSSGSPYTVALDNGIGSGATAAARKMTGGIGGSDLLTYSLYTDTGRSNVWGGATTVAGTGNGGTQTLTVYGRIPGSQLAASPGSYTDTVTITVAF